LSVAVKVTGGLKLFVNAGIENAVITGGVVSLAQALSSPPAHVAAMVKTMNFPRFLGFFVIGRSPESSRNRTRAPI
jgi:hypothetical protein